MQDGHHILSLSLLTYIDMTLLAVMSPSPSEPQVSPFFSILSLGSRCKYGQTSSFIPAAAGGGQIHSLTPRLTQGAHVTSDPQTLKFGALGQKEGQIKIGLYTEIR